MAKLFEEVKVMFQDLPSRIERRLDPDHASNGRRRRRLSGKLLYELVHGFGRELPDGLSLLMASGQFKDDLPWLYELALDAYRYLASGDERAADALQQLEDAFRLTFSHPIMREFSARSKDGYVDAELMVESLHRAIAVARDRFAHRPVVSEQATSGWSEERQEILRRMWADGRTASEIANALGATSRNAVIVKAHRLGLKPRPAPVVESDEDE